MGVSPRLPLDKPLNFVGFPPVYGKGILMDIFKLVTMKFWVEDKEDIWKWRRLSDSYDAFTQCILD